MNDLYNIDDLSRMSPEEIYGAEEANEIYRSDDPIERDRLKEVANDEAMYAEVLSEQAGERSAEIAFGGFNDRFVPDDPNEIYF